MDLAFLGRQPIFTSELEVFAYELLFRSGQSGNTAQVRDGDQATANVVLNLLTDIGLERVVDDKPAFINVTRNLLLNADLSCLPPERIVLEVLEDIEPDPEVLAAVQRMAEAGYRIALDDVVYRDELEPLIELAHIIKVDLPQIPLDELPAHVTALKRRSVKLLVEKVETQEEFDRCRELGFDYFQGYFFCKPQVLSERRVTGNQMTAMRLLSQLQNPSITPEKIEELLLMDPALSFQVLRFVNSSSNGLSQPIESIRHAAVVLGVQRIRSFASMMVLRAAGESKPLELLNLALTRGKLCELLSKRQGDNRTDRSFTVGLLSVLDAFLDRPMQEVVELLPLSAEINQALLDHSGQLGEVLEDVIQYERAVQRHVVDEERVHPDSLEYVNAVAWANECLRSF